MPSRCRNCGERVKLKFCPNCGQAAREPRRPLFGMLGDFFAEFLSLDGRHLRTFLHLWVPGKLTELYLDGKRASYVTPVRVYLVSSLMFFLLVGFPAPDASKVNVYVDDVLIGRDEPAPGLSNMQLGTFDRSSWLGQRVAPIFDPKIEALRAMPAQRLLDEFFAGLERNVPTTLIVLVPFIALGLTLIYFRQPFFYVDHLVFALHAQSFLFLLFVLVRGINLVVLERFVPALLVYVLAYLWVMPVYLLFAVKRIYRQRWPWTVIKCGVLGVFYFLIIPPIVALTMMLVIRGM